jgi:hypothetical protein
VIDVIGKMPRHKLERWATRSLRDIRRIIIHHSVTERGENQTELEHLQSIARQHARIAKWESIAYHICVFDTGNAYQVNRLDRITYHAGNDNRDTIGICMIGRLHKREPTAAQIATVRELVEELDYPIFPHRAVSQTVCPGTWEWDMLTKVAAIALVLAASGKATRYNPGVMDIVVKNRLNWGHITQEQVDSAQGFVALRDKGNIGDRVLLELPDGSFAGPYLVVDCGKATDQEHLDKIGFAVDLSYELAEKHLTNINVPLRDVKVWLFSEGKAR